MAVIRRIPDYEPKIEGIRDTLVAKYKSGVISAITDFRQLSKIASAIDNLGVVHREARKSLDRVFNPKVRVGIREAYESTVEFQYDERKATRHVASLISFVDDILEDDKTEQLDAAFLTQLRELYQRLRKLLSK